METDPHAHGEHHMGEHLSEDMRRPAARHANAMLRRLRGSSATINLGEHGDVSINHVRFRDAVEEGQLLAYVRQEAADPKVIIPVVVALGVVAAGIHNLKHNKK